MSARVYWDADRMNYEGVSTPSILGIGDSWFWYFPLGGSVINQVAGLLKSDHTILTFGNNGAEVLDYVSGKYAKEVKTALKRYGSGLSAVFISGGGNDFAGFSDLRPLLKLNCSDETIAADCFKDDSEVRSLGWLMRKTADNYMALIGLIFAYAPSATVVFHNYDYAVPTGKGGWLKPALDEAKVPSRLQHKCMKYIIDRFTHEMESLAALNTEKIVFVDTRNTLAENHWANELHPTKTGCKLIAKKWRASLKELNIFK